LHAVAARSSYFEDWVVSRSPLCMTSVLLAFTVKLSRYSHNCPIAPFPPPVSVVTLTPAPFPFPAVRCPSHHKLPSLVSLPLPTSFLPRGPDLVDCRHLSRVSAPVSCSSLPSNHFVSYFEFPVSALTLMPPYFGRRSGNGVSLYIYVLIHFRPSTFLPPTEFESPPWGGLVPPSIFRTQLPAKTPSLPPFSGSRFASVHTEPLY